jgi:crotonobetainyl-CoA:carnitine CoA-transferase CaiB-like acyl-CoA transferase
VIVFGAELARLFCELGAGVIKVESRAFPDGARVSPVHFAIGHRGSNSLGVNLRSGEGVEVIKRLVAQCDVVLSNFKPGTLEKLGLAPQTLREINPEIVVVSSSALGASGPWRGWMGYGPLVRCVSGLSSRWRYAGDEDSFSDSTTIHPDHYAARVCAVTVLAALISRRRSACGAEIATSQAEAILMQIAPLIAHEALRPGKAIETPAPWGVYPCAGDDEWCVITVRDDADWRALRVALGDPDWAARDDLATLAGRIASRAVLDAQLAAWTSAHTPRAATAILQRHGVAAGFMQRSDEYERDPQLAARGFLRTFVQPGLEPMRIENAPFRSERIPAPAHARAPAPGEHTRDICRELLGLDDYEIDRLLDIGALEEPSAVAAASTAALTARS